MLNAISGNINRYFFPGARQGGYKVHLEEKSSKNNYRYPGKGVQWVKFSGETIPTICEMTL